MDGIRAYLLSVTSAALLCALIRALTEHSGSGAGLIRLLSGVFLCFTVISPVTQIQLDNWLELPQTFLEEGAAASAEGEDYASSALRQQIRQSTEAYILDMAHILGAEVNIDVTVSPDDPPVPESVRLSGEVSAYVRAQLTRRIEEELDITEENQQWTD